MAGRRSRETTEEAVKEMGAEEEAKGAVVMGTVETGLVGVDWGMAAVAAVAALEEAAADTAEARPAAEGAMARGGGTTVMVMAGVEVEGQEEPMGGPGSLDAMVAAGVGEGAAETAPEPRTHKSAPLCCRTPRTRT